MSERITITLPEELADRVKLEAKRRRVSVSEYVRSRLDDDEFDENGERILPFESLGVSDDPGIGANFDEELRRTRAGRAASVR